MRRLPPKPQAVFGSRKWRQASPVPLLQAFQQQRSSPSQQVVILVQVGGGLWWARELPPPFYELEMTGSAK